MSLAVAGAVRRSPLRPSPETITAQAKDDKPKPKPKHTKNDDSKKSESELRKSQLDQFKAYASKNGTSAQKAAVTHVEKIDYDGDKLYTNLKGDMFSADGDTANLLTGIWKEWKNTKGDSAYFIFVYNASGEDLA